jgi:hypothetical protein
MAEQSLIRDHRAAVALNNMGVSLLERRAYRHGMETLKDAILVMESVLRPQSKSRGYGVNSESTSSAEAKVHRAVRRMANPHHVPSAVSSDVISHGGATSHPSSFLASPAFTSPVRIEATDLDCPEDRDPDLDSAIMINNFALAHLCVAKNTNSPIKLQERARKLFNMAYSIISNQNGLSRLSEDEMRRISESRLLLAVAVMSNVVRVLTEMGEDTEANESYQRLVRLGNAVEELQGRNPLKAKIAAAAAA